MNAALQATRERTTDVALRGICQVAQLLAVASPREVLPEILSVLLHLLELSDAAIALRDADSEPKLIGVSRSPAGLRPRMAELLQQAVRRIAATHMPWIVESEWVEPGLESVSSLRADTDLDLSFVAVPIKDQGQVIGVLCIERVHSPGDQAEFCFDADVRMLSVIANMVVQGERLGRSSGEKEVTALAQALPTAPENLRAGAVHPASTDGPRWQATLNRAQAVAKSTSTVLLRGESGSGKEVLARFIHEVSARRSRPMISINCAALSESLLESELFGHEKGAYTGASSQRKGRFELADGGTLFLDEIGEISRAFQARLLRVLQLGEFERVGGMTTLKVDVRVIAATHRNLEQEVQSGRFRADLYYRISVVPLFVPALRERAADIPGLASEFLRRFNASNGTDLVLEQSAMAVLLAYRFPGNVRELENSVFRAASFARALTLTADDFAWLKDETLLTARRSEPLGPGKPAAASAPRAPSVPLARLQRSGARGDADRERLISALERAGWVQAKAARLLGLTPRQIAYALQKYQIAAQKF